MFTGRRLSCGAMALVCCGVVALVCAHAPLPCRQIRVAARMRLLVCPIFFCFRYRCFVSLLAQDMASDLSLASAPCFSAAKFVVLCCFSVTTVLQSRYVVFFPVRGGVFRPEWSLCGPQRWVCLDGAFCSAFSREGLSPFLCCFFLWSFLRSHAGSFCDAAVRDVVVRCVKSLNGSNGSKIETLPMVA